MFRGELGKLNYVWWGAERKQSLWKAPSVCRIMTQRNTIISHWQWKVSRTILPTDTWASILREPRRILYSSWKHIVQLHRVFPEVSRNEAFYTDTLRSCCYDAMTVHEENPLSCGSSPFLLLSFLSLPFSSPCRSSSPRNRLWDGETHAGTLLEVCWEPQPWRSVAELGRRSCSQLQP